MNKTLLLYQLSSIFTFKIGFLDISWLDILDILLVTVLLFNLYKLIRGSVALKVFIGFLSLYLMYLVVKATKMELLTEILGQFMGVGVLTAIILFQQEIRKFLLLIGNTTDFKEFPLFDIFRGGNSSKKEDINISPIIEALKDLGGTNTGALIVISKDDELKLFAESGDILDGKVSKRLLLSIFFKNSPLHDGAAIVHKDRIVAARCILPVSDSDKIPANLGLRHRAAIGITEINDVAVLVASEETGQLSFVKSGKIHHNLSLIEIRRKLNEYISGMSQFSQAKPPMPIQKNKVESVIDPNN